MSAVHPSIPLLADSESFFRPLLSDANSTLSGAELPTSVRNPHRIHVVFTEPQGCTNMTRSVSLMLAAPELTEEEEETMKVGLPLNVTRVEGPAELSAGRTVPHTMGMGDEAVETASFSSAEVGITPGHRSISEVRDTKSDRTTTRTRRQTVGNQMPLEQNEAWRLVFTWTRSPDLYEFGEEGWSSVGAPPGTLSGVYGLYSVKLFYRLWHHGQAMAVFPDAHPETGKMELPQPL
ncbi:unnamed protein product [Protopolystoma xenopodis]|uniref:Uncharacterized protein n=1 Tax=Protopolystoma xenopodis TaxID=117903 RepID=A0A3S5CL94_9PLAT|nr:unnamed protein product [Protopolystoma xenopodis]